jgi:hypothetical protein
MFIKKYLIAFGLPGFIFSGFAFADENQKTQRFEADVTQAQSINLEIPAGQVAVVGTAGSKLIAEVKASCKDVKRLDKDACQAVLNELDWSKKIGKNTEIGLVPEKITRYDNIQIEVRVSLPADKNVNVNLAAGDLSVEGTSACITASVNAGQLHLKLKESQLASAELHAKVGDATLTNLKGETRAGERSMLVGADLSWNKGTGACRAKAEVMAGAVHLTLY